MSVKCIRIDGASLSDWESFHTVFANAFGFPAYYGRNMDAWIDCISDLAEPTVLYIDNVDVVPDEIYRAIVECSAFVNLAFAGNGLRAVGIQSQAVIRPAFTSERLVVRFARLRAGKESHGQAPSPSQDRQQEAQSPS